MDDLKQSVQNATYEQKDPLLIYKFEAFELFQRNAGQGEQGSLVLLVQRRVAKSKSAAGFSGT